MSDNQRQLNHFMDQQRADILAALTTQREEIAALIDEKLAEHKRDVDARLKAKSAR